MGLISPIAGKMSAGQKGPAAGGGGPVLVTPLANKKHPVPQHFLSQIKKHPTQVECFFIDKIIISARTVGALRKQSSELFLATNTERYAEVSEGRKEIKNLFFIVVAKKQHPPELVSVVKNTICFLSL